MGAPGGATDLVVGEGHRAIDASQPCPGNLDLHRLLREAVALDRP